MLKYLLDTDTVIYTMKNRPRQVKRRFQQHYGRIGISAVTVGELVFGAEHSSQVERNLADIEGLVSRLEVLPFDTGAAYHFGQIRAALYRDGRIGPGHQQYQGILTGTGPDVRKLGRRSRHGVSSRPLRFNLIS